MVNTLLARHEQTHRNDLSHNMAQFSRTFQDQLRALTAYLSQHADPTTAARQALDILNSTLGTQSALWSFVDDFRYLAVLCFLCAPIPFAMAKVLKRGGATMAH